MTFDTVPSGRVRRYKNAKKAILGLLGLSGLLQVAAFCTPGWVVTSFPVGPDERKMQRGLWFFISCVNEYCDTRPFTKLDDYPHYELHEDGLLEYQVEASIALFTVVMAFTCAALACRATDHFNKRLLWASMAVTSLVSSAMALLAVGRIADATIKEEDKFGDDGPFDAPYSVILLGVAGLMCFAALVTYIAILCYCRPVASSKNYVEKPVLSPNSVPYTVPPSSQERVIVTEKHVADPYRYSGYRGPPSTQERVFVTEKRVVEPYPLPHRENVIVTERPQRSSGRSYHSYDRYAQVREPEHYDVIAPEPIHVKMEILQKGDSLPGGTYSTTSSGYRVY